MDYLSSILFRYFCPSFDTSIQPLILKYLILFKCSQLMLDVFHHWRSSHYAVTHVRIKNVTFKEGHLM